MKTAVDYLLSKGWKISSDPRYYEGYPDNYGLRNFTQNGINYDSFCGGYHRAFDFYSNETNDVPAITSGTVITSEPYGNFGGTVEIRDSNGNDWIYGHLQRDSLRFSKGDKVNQGDIVGLQGSSNFADLPMAVHLHLQLRPKGVDLANEKVEVCSGIPMEKYDISKLNQKLDKSNNGGNRMSKKIMLVAGHGGVDSGAVGNGTNERDFIRKNIVDNVAKYLIQAGHQVHVFDKRYDMLTSTFNGTGQHGLYWIKQNKYDEVIEFHLDAASPQASGGHVIIWGGYEPDKVDLGLQKALTNTVGVLHGISKRTDLGNARVASQLGVSYRLVELGFITSAKDMAYIRNNLQDFTKKLAEGIHGNVIGGSAVKSATIKPVSKPKKAVVKKTPAKAKAPKVNINANRGRSTQPYFMGTIDNLGAEVRKRSGNRIFGFNWNKKAGYSLKAGDVVYIFEQHKGWGRIYTGESKGKGSNDWVWLGRVKPTKVFK